MVYLPVSIQFVLLVAPRLALGECNNAGDTCDASLTSVIGTILLQSKMNVQQVSSDERDVEENGEASPNVKLGPAGEACTGGYSPILSEAACWAAMDRVGKDHYDWDVLDDYDYYGGIERASDSPKGCYLQPDQDGATWFNTHPTGKYNRRGGSKPYCSKNFDVTNAELLFVGDSDIDYWHHTSVDFPGSFNIGIGGSTCEQWKGKVDWVVDEFQPKTVLLVCGENDFYGNSLSETFKNFKSVVQTFVQSGTRVLYMGTKPEPDSQKTHKKHNAYDALIRSYAEKLKSDTPSGPPLVMIDVMSSFLELGNPLSLYADDKLHMSPEGYALWVTWAKTALEDMASNAFGCWLWQNGRCVSGHVQGPSSGSGNACPSGLSKITTETACRSAAGARNVLAPSLQCKERCGNPGWKAGEFSAWKAKRCSKWTCKGCSPCRTPQFNGKENAADWPSGCYYCSGVKGCTDGTWFNEHQSGSENGDAQPVCVAN